MDYVNLQVAIGGDTGNTVPKFNVPVSEIPVLMAIHGPDALFDFEPVDPVEDAEDLSSAEELQRLRSIYGHVTDGDGENILRQVYPGAGAQVVTSLDALDIPEGAFKTLERVSAKKPAKKTARKPAAKKEDDAPEGDDKSVLE